ncbi:hypothetical protein AKO1_006113 [Acrasis kona]|uniref:Uncharacterized protein n=1 Tax=Acrasis kona TaxID=1008807 RepID=A0AAW2YHA3_9EUKA
MISEVDKRSTTRLISSKRLSAKDDIEPQRIVCEIIECMMRKDWIGYGNLLSDREVKMGLQEIKNPSITPQQYRTEIVPTEMRQNKGPYQDLVDYEQVSEAVINDDEVQFVFRFTYQHQQKCFSEEETVWVVRDQVEQVEEELYENDDSFSGRPRDYKWRVSFHGTNINTFSNCLKMNWLKRIVSACAVVPSYNDNDV